MIAYRAKFTREEKGIPVTFPDVPEAITSGSSEQEAMEFAVDALEVALSEYIRRRRDIPWPSKGRGSKGTRLVVLPALSEAKLQLYKAMRSASMRKAELARKIGWQRSQMDRLLDLTHASQLDQIEVALKALD